MHQLKLSRTRRCLASALLCMLVWGLSCTGPAQDSCLTDADCDDGLYCNGSEACDPENAAADDRGCMPGSEPCTETLVHCIEESDLCVECVDDADCDNGQYCDGAETCAANFCVHGLSPCVSPTAACVEATDSCIACIENSDCDDGVFCNGPESCENETCVTGEPPCPDECIFCIEELEGCNDPCVEDADCDDGLYCNGTESCVDCACVSSGDPCLDDGLFCNGTESCDEAADECISSADPCPGCPESGACFELADACLEPAPCESDEDCADDGVFCNGPEVCGAGGCCEPAGYPCPEDDPCNFIFYRCLESSAGGECEQINGFESTELDAGCDVLTLGDCPDVIIAPLRILPNNNLDPYPTLNSCDVIDGGGGDDTLKATFSYYSGPTAPTLHNIETLEITATQASNQFAISAENMTGLQELVLDSGYNQNNLTVTDIPYIIYLSIMNQDFAADLSFESVASLGTADTMLIQLENVESASTTIGITTGTTNGFEALTIASYGHRNEIAGIVANGTTLSQMSFIAVAPLVVTGPLPSNATSIVASESIAPITLTSGATEPVHYFGGISTDTFTGGAGNDTIAGDAGDDKLTGGAGIDTISGNSGADEFRLSSLLSANRDTITDFDDTPTTGDRLNLDSDVASLSGTDNFASSASVQSHLNSGNLVFGPVTEVAIVRSAVVSNFTEANSLNGTDLLAAIGGTMISWVPDGQYLLAVADTNGNVGVYFGDAGPGDVIIAASELSLLAVLQGSSVNIAGLDYTNFSNVP